MASEDQAEADERWARGVDEDDHPPADPLRPIDPLLELACALTIQEAPGERRWETMSPEDRDEWAEGLADSPEWIPLMMYVCRIEVALEELANYTQDVLTGPMFKAITWPDNFPDSHPVLSKARDPHKDADL